MPVDIKGIFMASTILLLVFLIGLTPGLPTLAGSVALLIAGLVLLALAGTRIRRLERQSDTQQARLQMLELAQSQTLELTCITDAQGTILYANPALRRSSGYSDSDLVGNNTRIFKSGLNNGSLYQTLWSTITTGQTFEDTLINKRQDGSLYYERKRITPILDDTGKPSHYVSCGIDVTAQIDAEQQSRFSEERFATAMRQGHDCLMDWNLTSQAMYFSPSWKAMLGYTDDDLPNTPNTLMVLLHPDDRADVMRIRMHAGNGQVIASQMHFRLRHRDGNWRLIEATLPDSGNLADEVLPRRRLLAICVDITDRRRSEIELRLLSTALQQVGSGVLIADAQKPDLPMIYANPAFEKLTGYSFKEIQGQSCRCLQGDETSPEEVERLRQAIRDGRECEVVLLNYRKDGSRFWLHLSISPVHDEQGALTHFIGVQTDITKLKQTEAELRVAKEAAEQADRLKSEFLSTMSHELRTPLNGILGMTELLLESGLNEEQLDYAGHVQASSRDMLTMVTKILDYVKLMNGELEIMTDSYSPEALLRACIHWVEPQAARKGLTLILSIAPDTPASHASDVHRLRQALMELLDNAIKFTASGAIELQSRVGPDGELILGIADSGEGIDDAQLARLFQPFTQLDGSHRRKHGGTGMGLSLSKAIVERLGGKLAVSSQAGKGSRFEITLPPVSQEHVL